ncbi:MAG: amino acid ABC transporter permease [Deferribacteraceae bacterium]|jgi:polar amino acid transport system permease protein|nr:amino acid ABC transporter permease [Deferribacteraceae bacterium]
MFLDWSIPLKNFGLLATGAGFTLVLTIICFLLSMATGVLFGIGRSVSNNKPLYFLLTAYIEAIRNTPVLVQIFLIYRGLPQLGIYLSPIAAGIIAMVVNNTAYIAEIMRSGINSVYKGQWEAAKSIGLTTADTMISVILPQALRNVFPALVNQFILILFGTSLLSAIDVRELTQVAYILNSETFRTMEIFLFVMVIYYVLSLICTTILGWVNKKFFPAIHG